MGDKNGFKIRWIKPGTTARQVYALPQSIPWPDSTPPPSLDDYFLNLSALLAATESPDITATKWSKIAEMCRHCEQASEYMENFSYPEALEVLEDAESAHPCAFVHWQRCICHLELRNPEQAMAAAYHATSLAPRCAVFWRVFGELCLERGLPEDAAQAFEKAFFGGERTPSVISGMRSSGLLVPNPAQQGEMLVSPAVARAILEVHIKSAESRRASFPRLRDLARRSLESDTTADIALAATACLMAGEEKTDSDSALHAEALWASASRSEAVRLASSLCLRPEIPPPQLARMTRKILPARLLEVSKNLQASGKLDRQTAEELFPDSDPKSVDHIENFIKLPPPSPLMTAILADRLPKTSARRRIIQLASSVLGEDSACHEALLLSAKSLLELGEYEKACAAVSRVPENQRGSWGQFVLAEALWKLDQPKMCLEALLKVHSDSDDALNQNVQMRTAQCQGFLKPLAETSSISPTRRLVRPILVSGPEWTSVVAPAGLPASSYIRIQIGSEVPPSEYRAIEFSRTKGEIHLGSFSVTSAHNTLALAIDPDGKIFVGAKLNGAWVDIEIED